MSEHKLRSVLLNLSTRLDVVSNPAKGESPPGVTRQRRARTEVWEASHLLKGISEEREQATE